MGSAHAPDHETKLGGWDALRRPIWVFDPYRLCGVYANAAALKLWGAESLAELLGRDFSKLSPAVRARTFRLAEATADGAEIAERWTFYPNGEPVTVQATISTYWLDEERPVLLFEASPLEVEAEERRAVEALRHTSALITLLDPNGGVLFSNPAAFAAYGSAAQDFNVRFADAVQARAVLSRVLAGDPVAEIGRMLTAAGARWHHLDAREVLDPVTGTAGVLLNELDVTERVEAERAKAAAEQKSAMAEARQRFLTDMSHELRTPLNAVIGFSDLLRRGGLAPEQEEQAQRIHASGEMLISVVNEMIHLSELQGWNGHRGPNSPPDPVNPARDTLPKEEIAFEEGENRALRVLYVDDNAHNRALVTAILATQGISCATAEDGDDGLDFAREGCWDLILMDIQMPRMDGVQSTRAIRALPAPAGQVPIVAITANTLPNQVALYSDAGMNDCIPKPIEVATLLDRVAYWSELGPEADVHKAS